MSAADFRHLADAVLTTDPRQRIRLMRCGTACVLMLLSVFGLVYLVWAGMAQARPVLVWSIFAVGGVLGFFGLIRSGANLRFADPSLTLPQMLFGLACGATAYTLAGRGRGAVFPIMMMVLMFGLYSLTPRQVKAISLVALAMFGGAMALMARLNPAVYEPAVEVGHFLVIAIMLPAVSMLAGELSQLRDRLRRQRAELAEALARIQQLASRDDLTGLPNRRHMQALVEAERERSARAGINFCLAVLDIDRFKRINDTHGHPTGDRVLRSFAREAAASLRSVDTLARWGGEEFLLLMPEASATLARLGVERLRSRVESLRVEVESESLAFTLSAGVVEHAAGETVAETIARADRALYRAKQQGRNCVVSG